MSRFYLLTIGDSVVTANLSKEPLIKKYEKAKVFWEKHHKLLDNEPRLWKLIKEP